MNLKIDPNVTFDLNGERKVTLDAYELSEWKRGLFELKGSLKDGSSEKTLTWKDIIPEMTGYVASRCPGIMLVPSEAIAIFNLADSAWDAAQKNWQPSAKDLPTSPPSTDPRYAED